MNPDFYFKAIFFLGCTIVYSNQNVINKHSLYSEGDVCKKGDEALDDHICKQLDDCSFSNVNITYVSSKPNDLPKCMTSDGKTLVCCPPIGQKDARKSDSTSIASKMCDNYAKIVDTEINEVASFQRIFGGTQVKSKELSHMALIGYSEGTLEWLCGGSLISNKWILSAAHCAYHSDKNSPSANKAILGKKNVSLADFNPAIEGHYKIVQIVVHPKYNTKQYYYDIALFRLKNIVKFSMFIQPICLDVDPMSKAEYATISGWGLTGDFDIENTSTNVESLMKAEVRVVPQEECKKYYPPCEGLEQGILETQICAGNYKNTGKSTCKGDSGGPLQVPNAKYPNMFTEIGLTSFGSNMCSKKSLPSAFTRVSHYVKWIVPIVWPEEN